VVTLKLKQADFRLLTRRQALRDATQLADRIYRTGRQLFDAVPAGRAYRLLGVGISDLCPAAEAERSGDLLDPEAARRGEAERAADAIRARFGPDAILKGRGLR
jgi:DNA polymerase-4